MRMTVPAAAARSSAGRADALNFNYILVAGLVHAALVWGKRGPEDDPMRLDPLTQTVTAPAPAGPPKPVQMPPSSIAPTEQVARFVTAADDAAGALAYESAYAAVRIRRRMTGQISGLSDLDARLSNAAAGLRAAHPAGRADPAAEAAARNEARMAELRAAASALNVAISGARSDVAVVLKQMQAELAAAMDALAKGGAQAGSASDGVVASASGNGEALIRRAKVLGAR